VIVPDGVLFGSSKAHVELRKMLVDQCELQGVISMPSGVFKPYAGVSTAVIIFVRGGETKNVWFYDMQADGRTLDDKRDKIPENDIPDIIREWAKKSVSGNEERFAKCFYVPVKEIRAEKFVLSINRYRRHAHTAVQFEPPSKILSQLVTIENEILRDLKELQGLIK
jgi:type I restriction enzyme M protein